MMIRGQNIERIEPHLVSLLNPTSFEAEQFRTLRHMVEQMRRQANLSMIAVSSPAARDGKTITSINLAGSLAQAPEAKVLLVDTDLRHPSVAEHLGLGRSGNRGLIDVIVDRSLSFDDVVRRCPEFNLALISSGRPPTIPYEVLKSERLGEIWQEARQRFEYIVLDTPPLVPFPDCRLIGKWVDGFLVVVTAHKTSAKLLEEAINVVDPAKMLGLVFNNCDRPQFGYYYPYAYEQGSERKGWLRRFRKKVNADR